MTGPAIAGAAVPSGILILGAAKSGTTALFYAVRNALTEGLGLRVEGLFEPRSPDDIRRYLRRSPDEVRLVKALLAPMLRRSMRFTDLFDRRIIIFRDPRDNVVSRLVFMLKNIIPLTEPEKIEAVLDLLRRKERDPESLSVVAIISEIARLSGRPDLLENVRGNAVLPARMKQERGGEFFLMPYDDLVAENFGPLSAYLGFPVSGGYRTEPRHAYVARRKESGDWRNWFLDEDVRYFATEVADAYRLLGFDPDERPAEHRHIPPSTCSEYAAAQFERVREKRRQQRAALRERERRMGHGPGLSAGAAV
ncbi:hypothetical protein [Tepidiforma sp.]|uniref:hypothetical protein n=1 Tax=Tepidiforma sp. TaxID=2682230 RepID=UPI00262E5A11|nr:hypothetical protein [Tepidiforma sp.]MCX7619055.1 sulfotransferase domain-containing protein [Tepidiforma sp.]